MTNTWFRSDDEFEADEVAAFAHMTVEQMEARIAVLNNKRNLRHAEYAELDRLANAIDSRLSAR